MTHQLKSRDIIALGFMTFALFVGAGNIIFPPMVGLQAGEHVWTAAIGFLITAVGLPVLTVVALAKVGGGVDSLSTPIGKSGGHPAGDRLLSGCRAVICDAAYRDGVV
ncbi:branched-chain amino acid ABC transporter [Salmonella enterica subsp. arizonae]|nr:branched-chain amino acid ABC transporter [Salmonella enterica subsp. arizonae]